MAIRKFSKRLPVFQIPIQNRALLYGDLFLIAAAVFGSFVIRLEWSPLISYYMPQTLRMILMGVAIKPIIFYFWGLYRQPGVYQKRKEILMIFGAATVSSIVLTAIVTIMTAIQSRNPDYIGFPRTTLILDWLLTLIFVFVSRFAFKFVTGNLPNRSSQDIGINPRWFKGIVITLCLIGFALRLYYYGINRSLWGDEASLGLNIVNRSFIDLFKPLDYGQGSPLGFLLFQKVTISILGSKDYILRLLPLLAGLLSVPLMYSVSKRFLGQIPTLIGLSLFVLSPKLIYYASELKQYSTDVLTALVLLYIAAKCLEDEAQPRNLTWFGLAGSVALWVSHPSVFVFGGAILTLGLSFTLNKDRAHLKRLIWIGGLWAVNLIILYLISLRSLESNEYLLDYWYGAFAPFPPWVKIDWFPSHLGDALRDPAALSVNAITVGLLGLGIFSLVIRRWQFSLLLVVPALLTFTGSILERYPFAGRLLLFLIPFLLFILAEGIESIRRLLWRINKPAAGLVAAAFVVYFSYGWVLGIYENLQTPPRKIDIKSVIAYLSENSLSNDLIYVYHGAKPAFEYYAPEYAIERDSYILGSKSLDDPTQYLREIDENIAERRIWVVFSEICYKCKINEKDFILGHLDEIGLLVSEYSTYDTSVHLYMPRSSP